MCLVFLFTATAELEIGFTHTKAPLWKKKLPKIWLTISWIKLTTFGQTSFDLWGVHQQYFWLSSGGPRYTRTFYLQTCLFSSAKLVQKDSFLVKKGLFICKFKICGPKWRKSVSEWVFFLKLKVTPALEQRAFSLWNDYQMFIKHYYWIYIILLN